MSEYVQAADLVPLIEQWRNEGNSLDLLSAADTRLCRLLLSGEQATTRLERADRLLIALDYPPTVLAEIAPPERLRGGWTRPDRRATRRLTDDQVRAAHRLHIDGGLSIRELGRRLYGQYGYASPHACANRLSDYFMLLGLPRRGRIEATIAASTTHGRGARADKPAYKRWHRATFGPWPSDLKDYP